MHSDIVKPHKSIKQNSQFTYKKNLDYGRHGWIRLTPAYSVDLVEQIFAEFGGDGCKVLEPFSGTGTTPLSAGYRGFSAVATDINPFLIWLGEVKSRIYSENVLSEFREVGEEIRRHLVMGKICETTLPPLKNIERWWSINELNFVNTYCNELKKLEMGPVKDLLKIAFCRTMISLSNAAFNHQSMSFKERSDNLQLNLDLAKNTEFMIAQFDKDIKVVDSAILYNPEGKVRFLKADARCLTQLDLEPASFDLLVTSPPYPNRMSYIRELRPYMYWLGYLENAREAGELDWEAIGGTWGIATSRLQNWFPSSAYIPDYLFPILDKIRTGHEKNGETMARYVHKYFDDMYLHFVAAASLLKEGGTAHYIVGNSTFYGNLVPSERLYRDQLYEAGFKDVELRTIRKRNSNKELMEFHVIAGR